MKLKDFLQALLILYLQKKTADNFVVVEDLQKLVVNSERRIVLYISQNILDHKSAKHLNVPNKFKANIIISR